MKKDTIKNAFTIAQAKRKENEKNLLEKEQTLSRKGNLDSLLEDKESGGGGEEEEEQGEDTKKKQTTKSKGKSI